MPRRKQRIEFAQPGERRRRATPGVFGVPLTRRALMMRSVMAAGFATLGGKLFHMQIAEGSRYEAAAEDNILRFEPIKAARGRVLDRAGQPLAENRRSWTVRLTSSQLPENATDRQAVLDAVSTALNLKHVIVLDRALVPLGSEPAICTALGQRDLDIDSATILARITHRDATLVLLKDGLTGPDATALVTQRLRDIPGVRAVPELDFVIATHWSPDIPLVIGSDVDRETALMLASNPLRLPGIKVDDAVLSRQYTGGPPFAHILGYVGAVDESTYNNSRDRNNNRLYEPDDVVGKGGVEASIEAKLRGEKGGRWVQVDAAGVERFELMDRRKEPVAGLSAQLTIIGDFQRKVAEELQRGLIESNEAGKAEVRARIAAGEATEEEQQNPDKDIVGAGVAMAMNPKTGEILAMVSLPNFDNQLFVGGISTVDFNRLNTDEFAPLLDRSIGGLFPPGSVLKPLLAAAALESGTVKPEDTFRCLGNIRVPWTWDESQGNIYPCWERDIGHGDVNLYDGISQSCDVYFYNLGVRKSETESGTDVHYYIPGDPTNHYFRGMGIDTIEHYLKNAFGYGGLTGIELAGEAEGLVPNPIWLIQSDLHEYWSVGDTINVAIGQGHLLCTPLQMLNSTAAIANGGTLWKPRLIRRLVDEQGTVKESFAPEKLRTVTIKPEHIRAVQEGMRKTVTAGTGMGKIDVPGITIAAKSGTAEFGVATDGRYLSSHAWFTAYGPYEDPEICVAVLIIGGGAGSVNAGPVTDRILNAYFGDPAIRDAARA